MNYTITDRDVRMFLREAHQHSQVRRALPYVVAPLAIALIAAGAFNYLAPVNRVASQAPVIAPLSTSLPQADAAAPAAEPVLTPVATPLPVTLPDNTFAASDLKISAPITWNVGFTDSEMNSALENGVIHIAGTALPGQKGMTAIAGHSSNYVWAKGKFNSIFAPLTKAQPGQIFEINYQGTMYRYRVSRVFEVQPTDTQVLGENNMTGVRLITCTPVGTSLRRLIVDAEQIFPDPALSAPFNGNTFSGSLPSGQ
jgi:LPXTG-site transpeptidase (sortase) family protein